MKLTTRRLELRPLAGSDLDRLHAHWGSPGVNRWLWDGKSPTRERVAQELARSATMFAERGVGLWGVFRDDDRFIGTCGIVTLPDEPEELEIVFSIETSEWRRGYAFEAAQAVLHRAFDAGLDRVLGRCDRPNEPSRRLLEKLGTVFELASIEGGDDCYYRLKR